MFVYKGDLAMPKKKTALTIEERLQQALVPAEEQPYEVPENWVWVRLGAVCFFENGYAFKSDKFSSEKGIPVIRISNIKENNVDLDDCIKTLEENIDEKFIVHQGDLLIAMSGATTGKNGVYMSANIAYLNQRVGNIKVKNKELLIEKFRNFYIANMQNEILNTAYGGAQPNISSQKMSVMTFPLPPLSEQQRIVERIEELFAKLDEAKERLQEVADSFAVRKAAILHKAFTGELIGKQVTELVPLENLVDLIKIGPFGSSLHESDYIENGIPLVNPKHIVQQRIVPQSKISISDEKAEELSSYKLKENDIVLGRRGEMGRCAPISNREENWICGTGSMIIRLKKEYDAKLYSLILGSQATVTYLENSAVGSTLKNLNEKIVRKIPVPQFSNEEQHEIVRLIDDLLARERSAQQATEQALASIDLMKKSILARAFRGELGTNKASEASALELLKTEAE